MPVNIGKRIAELRTAKGMSQQTLANQLFVSRDLVSKWENGVRHPDFEKIKEMAGIFEISADSIVNKESLFLDELSDCFPKSALISEDEMAGILNDFLHRQSKIRSDVFIKRYYFQKSIAEISSEYGIGENHVRSILSKARRKLKTFVEEGHL